MPWFVPEQERRKNNRNQQRLQVPRWPVDDQSGDLGPTGPLKLMRDRPDVPVRQVRLSRVERHQATSEKEVEVRPQYRVVNLLGAGHFRSPLLLSSSRNALMISSSSMHRAVGGMLVACIRHVVALQQKGSRLDVTLERSFREACQHSLAYADLAESAPDPHLDLAIENFAQQGERVLRSLWAALSIARLARLELMLAWRLAVTDAVGRD